MNWKQESNCLYLSLRFHVGQAMLSFSDSRGISGYGWPKNRSFLIVKLYFGATLYEPMKRAYDVVPSGMAETRSVGKLNRYPSLNL
ncbi:hypothetical protein RIF29_42108 [Crotalaria pallida]|uniref:Uncharacterized protein n=1 Tax=Crotalaria pallida TaxID=3830 RepID=A0AAN9HQ05_CROPI